MSARPPSETLLHELRDAIDRDAEVPVGVQLAWALRSRIQGGSARPGDRLPGLREVAAATGLNHNTVRAVFQRLDAEGLIDSRQGSGTFVASVGSAPAHARSIAANAAREAHRTGVDPRDVAAALYVSPAVSSREAAHSTESAEAGERRRELRAQIAALERAIGELESEHPGIAPVAPRALRAGGPALLSAEELQHVRAALVRRLASVQNAIDAQAGIAEPRARAPRAQRSVTSAPARAPSRPARAARAAASSPSPPAKPKRAARAAARVRPAAAET